MDLSFLKEQADGCRRLAENADQFTKQRLLNLAEKYDSRMSRLRGLPVLEHGALSGGVRYTSSLSLGNI
jgi:hypothetical protein